METYRIILEAYFDEADIRGLRIPIEKFLLKSIRYAIIDFKGLEDYISINNIEVERQPD